MSYDFEDYSWLEERTQELADKFVTYDPNTAIELDPRWYGIYRVRMLPVRNPKEFLVPYGVHWNVIPGTEDNPYTQLGCPKFSHNQYCPICDAIDTAIAEKRAKVDHFKGADGKNSIMVQRRFLIRCLLLDFEPGDGNGKNKVPVFTDLPRLKIMKIPAIVAKKIQDMVNSRDFGPGKFMHPVEGRALKIEKNSKIQNYWDINMLLDPCPVPEEFLTKEAVEQWPDISRYLPDTTAEQITEEIDKYKRNVHPIIVNHVLSIDAGPVKAQLPPVNKPSKEDLKNKLKSL